MKQNPFERMKKLSIISIDFVSSLTRPAEGSNDHLCMHMDTKTPTLFYLDLENAIYLWK